MWCTYTNSTEGKLLGQDKKKHATEVRTSFSGFIVGFSVCGTITTPTQPRVGAPYDWLMRFNSNPGTNQSSRETQFTSVAFNTRTVKSDLSRPTTAIRTRHVPKRRPTVSNREGLERHLERHLPPLCNNIRLTIHYRYKRAWQPPGAAAAGRYYVTTLLR